jgi:hypothetical protein
MADATTDGTATDTRLHPRYPAESVSGITCVRLSPGDVVTLINISASGILVQGKTRFVPGTRLNVIFEGPRAPGAVKGRIIRCQVSAIASGGSLQYQSAIAFDANIDLRVDEAPPKTAAAVEAAGTAPATQAKTPEPAGHRLRNRW